MKSFSIIGLVVAIVSLFALFAYANIDSYKTAIGWGVFSALYLIAMGIVLLIDQKR